MEKTIVRNSPKSRTVHWFHTISTILLFLTGLALFVPNLNWMAVIFGGFPIARLIHRIAGVVFVGIPLLGILFGFSGFQHFMRELFAPWDDDDKTWLKKFVPYLFNAKIEMPPSGELKSGQRFADWFILVFALLVGLSGILLWGQKYLAVGLIQWMHVVHDVSMIGLGVVLLGHIYLGAGIFQPYRGSMRLMFGDGMIKEADAKYHWRKWADKKIKS